MTKTRGGRMGGARGRAGRWATAAGGAAAVLAVVLTWTGARGDEVRVGQFWVSNVQVQRIDQGQVIYLAPTGSEVRKPLAEVGGIKLDRFPGLGQAIDAMAADHPDDAAAKLKQVIAKAGREPWVQRYAERRLVDALARQGDATTAASTYIDLAKQKDASAAMLGDPPTEVVAGASAANRKRIAAMADQAAGAVGAALRPALEKLRDAARSPAPSAPGAQDRGADSEGPDQTGAISKGEGAVVLPSIVTLTPIVDPLKAGDFAAALEVANKGLGAPDRLPEKLYLQGMALEGLADQSDDPGRYMDAGLAFMRVAIYFPSSAYTGPALLEAGYIHEKIGKLKLARQLYEQAGNRIDEEKEPTYYARWEKLTTQANQTNPK